MNRIDQLLSALNAEELEELKYDWSIWARQKQLPPAGDWTTWLLLGGRGAGKTRAGAEWVRSLVTGPMPYGKIALIGETISDARAIMVEGVSGLMAIHRPDERPEFHRARNQLEWPNGAVAQLFSAREPESLRGPQFSAAWADEFCKWPNPNATWDMLQFGLRLGKRPRQLITTTPKPMQILQDIMALEQTRVTSIKTNENAKNLAPAFFEKVVDRYRDTSLGRQELDGEILQDADDALWRRADIERQRQAAYPALERIVVAVDPPVSAHERSDKCGIVVAGTTGEHFYVLADLTLERATPLVWAEKVVTAFEHFEADCVVAEVNQGGDLVSSALHQISPNLPVRSVHARRGKWTRAEPIALLYERGLVHHCGMFSALEDELCCFGPDGKAQGHSPDRLDALVWALTELSGRKSSRPRIRNL